MRFMVGSLILVALLTPQVHAVKQSSDGGSMKHSLEMPALLWGAPKRPDGSARYWDPKPLIDLGATMVSVYYRPLKADGTFENTVGMTPPKRLAQVFDTARPELDECRKHGIRIIGYADCIMFHPSMLIAVGIDCEDLYAIDSKGNRVSNNWWDKEGVFVSCVNNPHWLSLQQQVAVETAKAGFGGLMFDAYPYAIGPGYFCQCRYCKAGWKKFSEREIGKAVPLPDGDKLDFTKRVDRALFEWRQQSYVSYVKAIEKAVVKEQPDFRIVMNHWADSADFMYHALHGGLSHPSTEVGNVSLGDDPSLYMYKMVEGACGSSLVTVINGPDQIKPGYRYEAALAEAYAGGGTVYALPPTSGRDEVGNVGKRFYRYLRDNRKWYENTHSDADTAILYSWRDNAFVQKKSHDPTASNGQGQGYFREAASALGKLGVPYDCLVTDKGLSKARLSKYRVIVTPHLGLVDDKEAARLLEYVRHGGHLIVVGDLGRLREVKGEYVSRSNSLLTEWTGRKLGEPWVERVGKGEIEYFPEYSGLSKSVELTHQLRVKSVTPVETSVRANGDNRTIHLIRLGNPELVSERSVGIDYAIPAGYTVKSVETISPNGPVKAVWKVDSGRLSIELENMDSSAIIGVGLAHQ